MSEVLISLHFKQAFLGTLPNLILLYYIFSMSVKKRIEDSSLNIIKEELRDLKGNFRFKKDLPEKVRKFVLDSYKNENSQVINSNNKDIQKNNGKIINIPKKVELVQEGSLRLKKENSWSKSHATQVFIPRNYFFLWTLNLKMGPFEVLGRDRFLKGKAKMEIFFENFLKIAKSSDDGKINESTLQRYLAELVWMPVCLLDDSIEWEVIDSNSLKLTLVVSSVKASINIHFNADGLISKVSAMRFKSAEDKSRSKWEVIIDEYSVFNQIRIPSKCRVVWADDNFEWYRFKITSYEVLK